MQLLLIITTAFFFSCYVSRLENWYKPHGRPSECYDVICNRTVKYPEGRIRKLLNQKKKTYNKLFGSVIEPIGAIELPSVRSPRAGDKERNFCKTKTVTILPKIAYDEDLNAQFIVNLKGREQKVSFEVCVENECFAKELPLNYESRCRQLYNKVGLLYVSNKGVLEYGRFSVPSTCVCTYSKSRYF